MADAIFVQSAAGTPRFWQSQAHIGESVSIFFQVLSMRTSYLIFVIFFTHAKFLEDKIYTEIYTVN